jgi:ParB family chromosome partitioning protein
MSRKKRFGISDALTRGLSETIHVVENNSGIFRNIVLPLARIELDPDNPRKLVINITDVKEGISADDALYQHKQAELEKLKELAHTIQKSGVINPIVVYKRGSEFYRVVAGERRCLASILAGKQDIEARVFTDKPKDFDLKLLQWIENTAREDLSLDERILNVQDILQAYQLQHGEVEVTATLLKNITGLSLSQMSYYLAVLNAPDEVKDHIKNGNIRNLDKAALIANVVSADIRKQAIEYCKNGASLKELKQFITQQKNLNKYKNSSKALSSRGRQTTRVNMGHTENSNIIKIIIESVTKQKNYDQYSSVFSDINWMDLKQTAKAFRKLIDILEGKSI